MTFEHSTQAQNLAALRTRFQKAKGLEAAKYARWIYKNLTAAQIKNIFGLTDAQVTALRNKFATIVTNLEAVDNVVGE